MKFIWKWAVLLFFANAVLAQKKPISSRAINSPTNNQKDPVLSADGTVMIYLSDYSPTRKPQPFITEGNGFDRWGKPELVEKVFKNELDLINAYSFSVDGKKLFITSRRAKGIGGYDIWVTESKGNTWQPAINFGKPLNTTEDEGAASVSPDGKQLYFMRCSKITQNDVSGCRILVAEKRGGRWVNPEELPSTINNGEAAFPKILADNQTLLFSSKRPEGKGGWDFYLSRREGNTWTEPLNIEIANTEKDNLVGFIPASGDVMFFSGEYRGKEQLLIAKLPKELQPKKIIMMDGLITDGSGNPVKSIISAYDMETSEEVVTMLTDDKGIFKAFLPEGYDYDFSVYPFDNSHEYFSTNYDFEYAETSKKESLEVILKPLSSSSQFRLNNLGFELYNSEVDETSEIEILRLKRLMQKNPSLKVELEVYAESIFSDTIQSSEELTEIEIDSLYSNIALSEMDSIELDSLYSLEQLIFNKDSTAYLSEVNTTFHNDRTIKQAEHLNQYLLRKGFPEEKISVVPKSGPKGEVKEVVDYWVELKVVSY